MLIVVKRVFHVRLVTDATRMQIVGAACVGTIFAVPLPATMESKMVMRWGSIVAPIVRAAPAWEMHLSKWMSPVGMRVRRAVLTITKMQPVPRRVQHPRLRIDLRVHKQACSALIRRGRNLIRSFM